MICRNCGSNIQDGLEYCPYCGNHIEYSGGLQMNNPYINNHPYINPQPQKKDNKTLIIGISVIASLFLIALIAVGIIAVKMFSINNEKNNKSSSYTDEVSEITATEEQLTESQITETKTVEEMETTELKTSENQNTTEIEDEDVLTKGDINLIANRDFVAIGSEYGIDNIYADISIKSDGSFSGTEIVNEAPPNKSVFKGQFGDVTKGDDLIYFADILDVEPSWWQEMDYAQFFDKGFPVSKLPDYIKEYIRAGHYGQIIDDNNLPCMIIYNSHIKAVYAEMEYINTLGYDNSSDDSSYTHMLPFYGIWCFGSKDEAEADNVASDLRGKGFDGRVFVTTDWENLNSEKFYVVSAGVYSSESEANDALGNVQSSGYGDAYVKYSGSYIGD